MIVYVQLYTNTYILAIFTQYGTKMYKNCTYDTNVFQPSQEKKCLRILKIMYGIFSEGMVHAGLNNYLQVI